MPNFLKVFSVMVAVFLGAWTFALAAPEVTVDYGPLVPQVAQNGIFETNIHISATGFFTTRYPIDVVLVMDTSGSMAWAGSKGSKKSRLTEAKDALSAFIQNLDPQFDRAALVTFSGSNGDVQSGLTQFNKTTLLSRINKLGTGGSTPMGQGLNKAIREIKNARPDVIKAIVFAGDGHHNTGPGPECSYYGSVPDDVTVFTIGVGNDIKNAADCGGYKYGNCNTFDSRYTLNLNKEKGKCVAGETMLTEIARTGNGQGRYIPAPNAAQLTEIYTGLVQEIIASAVAHDVTVDLKLKPEFQFVSASQTPTSTLNEADGQRLGWTIPTIANGQIIDILVRLKAVQRLATQPQQINSPSSIKYKNSQGNNETKTINPAFITVLKNNQPPVANLTANPSEGYVNQTSFTFTATASDPDNDVLTYLWNLAGGTVASGCASTNTTCVLKYATTGSKNVQVTVQDPAGASASAGQVVSVISGGGSALNSSCSGTPTPAYTNQLVSWTASVNNGTAPYTYQWSGIDSLAGATQTITRKYLSQGTKDATVKVTDAHGQSNTATCSVRVLPPYPKWREVNPASQP